MRSWICVLLLLVLIGCSTAPTADWMDWRDQKTKNADEKKKQNPSDISIYGPDKQSSGNQPTNPYLKDINTDSPPTDSSNNNIPPIPAIANPSSK